MTCWPTKALGKLVLPTEQRDQGKFQPKSSSVLILQLLIKSSPRAMPTEQADSRRRLDDLFHSMLHRAFQREL